jgi:hypothetical protein
MPRNQVTDLITDQEMLFARLILAGTMTDRQSAEAAGLNPDTAAYTKAKPRVREYMLEHRAAVQEQLVQQEAQERHRQGIVRERVLARLWELANLSHEMTRNSISGQIKAMSMIVSIEGLIPDRKEKKSAEPSPEVNIFHPDWFLEAREKAAAAKAGLDPVQHQEESAIPDPLTAAAPGTPPIAGPAFGSNEYNENNFTDLSQTLSAAVPDPTAAFSIKTKPYLRRYGPF